MTFGQSEGKSNTNADVKIIKIKNEKNESYQKKRINDISLFNIKNQINKSHSTDSHGECNFIPKTHSIENEEEKKQPIITITKESISSSDLENELESPKMQK